MRITIVMGFFLPMPPVVGGATEKTWHRLAQEFLGRGHQVTIVSRTWKSWPTDEVSEGVRHLRLPGHDHTASLPQNLWHDLRWSLRIRRQLPVADVTIINGITLPLVLGAAPHLGRRVVMIGRMPKGQFRFYGRLDRVLAVSSPVLAAVRRESTTAAEKAIVTGYPIDWQRLSAPRSAHPVTSIGFIGRIHREKGLHLLVGALRKLATNKNLPPWRAIVCGPTDVQQGGSGPTYLAELQAELARGPTPVPCEFLPPLFNEADLAALYRQLDVFCYPSLARHGETFGVAVAEAMAAGAVPFVSALPCFTDYIQAGQNGIVFDQDAPDAVDRLATALARVIQDPRARQRMSIAAQQAVARYDFSAYANRLLGELSALK